MHELQPGVEVHFTAQLEDKDVPVVWTYRHGKGKVCYAVPGHTTGSMYNQTYQQVLQRGLRWVAE
jgi:type 1 glutamine amidotransferase